MNRLATFPVPIVHRYNHWPIPFLLALKSSDKCLDHEVLGVLNNLAQFMRINGSKNVEMWKVFRFHNSSCLLWMQILRIVNPFSDSYSKQECILVGCVLIEAVAISCRWVSAYLEWGCLLTLGEGMSAQGGVWADTPRQKPLRQTLPWADTP